MFIALTAVNVVIVLLAGYGSLHSMESPSFCGQTCHTPMHPQFTAWQDAPHSQVACVQCHIGEGGRAFVKYKMNGLRQLYHVVTGHYPRPIPGVADLRPAHRGVRDVSLAGQGIRRRRPRQARVRRRRDEHGDGDDPADVPGRSRAPTPSGRAIHWHADPRVRIEFIFTDAERQTIQFVKYTDAQGRVREYAAEGTTPEQLAKGTGARWTASTATTSSAHRVAPTPEQAVDAAIAAGRIDRGPAVRPSRRRAPDEGDLPDRRRGRAGDRRGAAKVLHRQAAAAPTPRSRVRSRALQDIYRRNVFPEMKVTFGTYPDNLGHTTSSGCFRCHDGSLVAKDGTSISSDCEYCHKQIERP